MISSVWVVGDNHTKLEMPSGEMVRPFVLEIFQVVFGRSSTFRNEKVRGSLYDPQNLAFSRNPAQPAIRLGRSTCYDVP